MKTRKTKNETPEQKLDRWMASSNRVSISYSTLTELGWEAGQVGYIEVYGMRYEQFDLENGKFCVVEWDEHGNISVA